MVITTSGQIVTEGFTRLKIDLKNVPKKINKAVKIEIVTIAHDIRNTTMRLMLDTPKTGNVYRRGKGKGKKKKYHIASSPGNPPAVDYGQLLRSIFVFSDKNSIEVGSIAPYAKHLEFGAKAGSYISRSIWGAYVATKSGTGLAPRPFLRPAMERFEPFIASRIIDSINKALR